MIHFTLYSRSYCHLCEDMLAALSALAIEDSTIDVIDVDADETLVALYDELVPVLMAQRDDEPGKRLCHYFLDEAAVRTFVAGD
ncbi:MAG TPA: glutaredoxin family protein [Oxalicibacterium sp.]|uniref:glutaredoxin family protein n=1 Tax=Oxalicibacterium sp. TaxID=2766525 RepID=UPI002BFAE34E|nr:glutaredoxin family protein [Oxalicibacterium sp.]HWU98580.1 glutaredoxin family protein [Oxalicibacterium sp.]